MRKVRRKSIDINARQYLLKAAEEGMCLSWNQYEKMLPQDGFAALGLTCFDCLLGPCRINPFGKKEEKTVCGLSRDSLVYRNLLRLIGCSDTGIDGESSQAVDSLFSKSRGKIENIYSNAFKAKKLEKRYVGLGVLKENHINICLEGMYPYTVGRLLEIAADLKGHASKAGAKGYNIVLAGDILPQYSCNIVSDAGGVEFAILTGMTDMYIADVSTPARGRNIAGSYHTIFAQTDRGTDSQQLEEMLLTAANAYTKRNKSKVLCSPQLETITIHAPLEDISEVIKGSGYKGICILGGTENVKLTQDELLCRAAERLKENGVLCLTYGNAAISLAKNGLTGEGSSIITVGGNSAILDIILLLKDIQRENVAAFYPGIATGVDLLAAFALAGESVKVTCSTRIPVDGSSSMSHKIGEMVIYAEPEAAIEKLLKQFKL